MKPSRAIVAVAAAGPNSRTHAKMNVSETENRAGSPGILIVNEPVNSASAAKMSQSAGVRPTMSACTEWAVAAAPAMQTQATYTFALLVNALSACPRIAGNEAQAGARFTALERIS